jgi:hypothetical protein
LQDGIGSGMAWRAVETGEAPITARELVGEGAVQLGRIVVAIQQDNASARVTRGLEMREPFEGGGKGWRAGAVGKPGLQRDEQRGREVSGGGAGEAGALGLRSSAAGSGRDWPA